MNIVRELRQRAGMQQKDLAISAGVSRPTVSEWEHNKKDPSGERLKKLSEIFDVDPGVILGYRSSNAPAEAPETIKTDEAWILARGVDKLPKDQREQALAVVRAMFAQYADYFEQRRDAGES